MGTLGGKRRGAGRKPGSASRKTRQIADAAAEVGITPLEWMLSVIRDEKADVKRRDEMARAAAPFMHPGLGAVEPFGKDEGPIHPPIDVRITYVDGGPDPDRPEQEPAAALPAR